MFDYRFEDAGQKGIFHQNERDGMAATAADYYYSSRDSASIRDNAAIIITRWIIRSSRNIHSHPLISGGTNSIFEEGSFLVFVFSTPRFVEIGNPWKYDESKDGEDVA